MTIKHVALIGANGHLGPAILAALLSATTFNVTILSRSSSQSTYPPSVHITTIPDNPSSSDLVHALHGQDALIVAFTGSLSALQMRLADAAVQAGVQRFVPADFGSCDSSSPRALDLLPLYRGKQKVRQHLQHLTSKSSLSWTSLVCGHFFDYGLRSGLLAFDLHAHSARIFDGGEVRFSATTLDTIARAVVGVLRKEEETRNRMLYIQSFCVTQNEILRSLERSTGERWRVEEVDSERYIKDVKRVLDENPSDAEATENLVSVLGIVDANWEGKEDFANSLLGLEGEDLDQVVKHVVGK